MGSGRSHNSASRTSPGRPSGRDDVERVRDASDIVRIIGEHVALKAKGREYVGLCPFHDDHSPSMAVVPHKQFYKCFSCGAGGDVFTFVQKFLRMEFREALEYLAERAGVQLTPRSPQRGSGGGTVSSGDGGGSGSGGSSDDAPGSGELSRADLHRLNQLASEFFRAIKDHPQHGEKGRAVIAKRAISPEMEREFGLGVSPDRWDGLLLAMQQRGIAPEQLAQAGLAKRRDGSSGCYDAFRNRVMFPILDRTGRTIAFGARKIDDADEPKYLNSPETPVFSKSRTLYALHLALPAMQKERTAIICEGYMDVIACHQAGFRSAVATLGTALTREHARVLRLACDKVVMLFDGDEAGQRAADRATEVFFAEPLDVAFVTLADFTDAKDPDELLKRDDGKAVFARALAGAKDLLTYRFTRLRARLQGAGIAALEKALEDEVARLSELGLAQASPVRQAFVRKQLAKITGLDDDTIQRVVRAHAARRQRPDDDRELVVGREGPPPLHTLALTTPEHLLGCILVDGGLWAGFTESDKDLIAPTGYRFAVLQRVAQAVHDLGEDGVLPSMNAVLSELMARDDDEGREAAVALMSRMYQASNEDEERVRRLFGECLARARRDQTLASIATRDTDPAERPPEVPGDDDAPVDQVLEAKSQLAAKPQSPPESREAIAARRLEQLRQLQQSMGPDRRRVPRPR